MANEGQFTDRVEAVDVFASFVDDRDPLRVLIYWGVAGQGKSTLIAHLMRLGSRGYRSALIDLADLLSTYPTDGRGSGRDIGSELLAQLADALLARSGWAGPFARWRYRQGREQAEALLIPGPSVASITATDGSTVSNSPVYIDARFEASALARSAYRQRQVDALVRAVAVTRRRRTLLFIDTGEWLWLLDGVAQEDAEAPAETGRWFTHEVLPRLLEAAPRLKVVLGCREPLNLPRRMAGRSIELKEWQPEDVASYLRSRGMPEQDVHEAVYTLCIGVPVWVALVADILVHRPHGAAAPDGDYLATLARGRPAEVWLPEVLLTRVDPELRTALICACVLDGLVAEAVTVMVDAQDLPENWLRNLSRYSFVQTHRAVSGASEQRVHQLVRTATLEHLRKHEPALLKQMNTAAAAYFERQGLRERYMFHAVAAGDPAATQVLEAQILEVLNEGRLEDCMAAAEMAVAQLQWTFEGRPQRRLLAAAALAKGIVSSTQLRFEEANHQLSEAQRLYKQEKLKGGQSAALRAQSQVAGRMHQNQRATQLAEQALRLAKSSGDIRSEADALVQLGERVYLQQSSRRRATDLLRRAADLYRLIGDSLGEARALMWLGDIARTAHQTAEATELLSLAFEAFTTAGHLVDSAIVLTQLGELYTQHGKVDEGHEKLAAAEQLVAGRDDKPSQHCLANIYRVLANSEVMRGGRNALKYLRRAQALFTETDDKQGQATTHRLHGQFAMHTGNEGSAFRHFTEARSLYTEVGDLIGQAHVAMFMGEMDLHHGTHTRGVALVTEAYRIYQRMGDPLGQGNTLHILGEEALRNGALNDAKSHIAQALKMHQAAGDDLATARDHVSLAELALEGGSRQQAREQLARAAKIYERQGYRPQSDRYTSIKNRIEAAR